MLIVGYGDDRFDLGKRRQDHLLPQPDALAFVSLHVTLQVAREAEAAVPTDLKTTVELSKSRPGRDLRGCEMGRSTRGIRICRRLFNVRAEDRDDGGGALRGPARVGVRKESVKVGAKLLPADTYLSATRTPRLFEPFVGFAALIVGERASPTLAEELHRDLIEKPHEDGPELAVCLVGCVAPAGLFAQA